MLGEFFEWLKTPAPKFVRQMGYVYSTVALMSRSRRQKSQWNEHIQQCYKLWDNLLEKFQPKSVAIIGSGPLTEVPIELLLQTMDKIILIDIVHPRKVRRLAKNNPKIELIELDVTGFVNWIQGVRHIEEASLGFSPPQLQLDVDLVVSANLLSQLSLEPEWFLTRKMGVKTDSPLIEKLINKLGEDHLKFLSVHSKNVVLYSDVERLYLSPKKEVLEKYSSRVPKIVAEEIAEWHWQLCPLGEESHEYSISMLIKAYSIQ